MTEKREQSSTLVSACYPNLDCSVRRVGEEEGAQGRRTKEESDTPSREDGGTNEGFKEWQAAAIEVIERAHEVYVRQPGGRWRVSDAHCRDVV